LAKQPVLVCGSGNRSIFIARFEARRHGQDR
jgi:hypothetical protein